MDKDRNEARSRTAAFQLALRNRGIARAVLSDEASIAYLGACWGYLGMDFGRPTLLHVPASGSPTLITPTLEAAMLREMTWIDAVEPWDDAGERSWAAVLDATLNTCNDDVSGSVAVERSRLLPVVSDALHKRYGSAALLDVTPVLAELRMIKSAHEIDVMRKAGRVAAAMMHAAHASLAVGVCEWESSLAAAQAGTKAAAALLGDSGWERFVSPVIHALPIVQSGADTAMVHRRACNKRYARGDPVYFCFCNQAEFKHYRLGFDRLFHIGEISETDARVQQAALDAQAAAIGAIRPGVLAEDVAAAADAVYAERGYTTGYRTGRSIGMAYLESPELKPGDKTVLREGMTFAVDGGISIDGSGGRIGDSVVVTADGCEYLTEYPREIIVVPA